MRRIQVNVQDLYAAMCATFMDAAAWFQQAGEQDISALAGNCPYGTCLSSNHWLLLKGKSFYGSGTVGKGPRHR